MEYRFEYNGLKIADVVYLDAGEILCIFEIYNTHKTNSNNRPEPWFEIDALTLINLVANNANNDLSITCIRCEKCEECIKREKIKKILNDKLKLEQIEKERRENETLKKQIETRQKERNEYLMGKKLEQIERDRLSQLCKCNIQIINLCFCNASNYEINYQIIIFVLIAINGNVDVNLFNLFYSFSIIAQCSIVRN
jgi:uncharacterized protein YkuJ